MTKQYSVQEFAELAGVTVRALHHYDRLGLLKPARTGSGYRMYRERELERLEQIVALKFIGMPLGEIKKLLDRNSLGLHDALQLQRRVLEEKRRLLDSALFAISEAEKAAGEGKSPSASLLTKIIEVIEMQDNKEWMMKYYSEEGKAKVEGRKHLWSPELQERVSKQWSDLIKDVETALNENPNMKPEDAKAQELAGRWTTLVEEFTGGDPAITSGLKNLYNDKQNWPAEAKQQAQPFSNPRVWEFMHKAIAARKR